ncbi:restriction endonuclease subunit S [Vibrio alginolyticus]|uniref:restriction endonuclease subunit S n=1 Tax=Vibrio alginolyticus TaxID=663 RepID=UPI00354C0504
MVPNGWKLTSLGEVCSGNLQTGPFGSQLHAHEYTDEGVPVLMPKDLINYRANNATAAKIPEHRADDLKKHVLKSGDLLFSRRGDVARFALIESDYPRSLCGTGCLKATPNKAHSPLFLSYFLQKNAVKKWLEQNAVGQTMPNMNTAILAELPIMVASSREEEDKIAKILSTWDKAIAATEKLIETSKQQKKALMQQLLTGKKRLVNPDTGKAFEGNWEQFSFGDVANISSKKHDPKKASTSVPCVELEHIKQESGGILGTADSNDLASIKNRFTAGDVLFGKLRPYLKKYAFPSFDGVCSTEIWVLKAKKSIQPEYLYQFVQTNIFISEANKSAGSKMPRADWGVVSELILKLPLLEEQKKITAVLDAADKQLELLEAKLAHFKQEKKALMQQLLTGKRRVKVDEMEVA